MIAKLLHPKKMGNTWGCEYKEGAKSTILQLHTHGVDTVSGNWELAVFSMNSEMTF